MSKLQKVVAMCVLIASVSGVMANFLIATKALAGITDNPGFSSGSYSVCNYPNQGDSVTGYGPDRNVSGITLTSTNWRCSAGGVSINGESTVAQKQPLFMEKLDLQTPRFGGGGYNKDLVSVSWDYDSDGTIDFLDSGPWNSWYLDRGHPYARGTYFSSSHSFNSTGTYDVKVTATYDDASTDEATGVVKVVADTVTASITKTLPGGGAADTSNELTDRTVYLSAGSSTSLSGVLSKYEWDLDGDGAYEVDGGTTSTRSTSFATSGSKTVGVRVTSRGGSTSTATKSIDVRKSPPSGEPGVSIIDGASYTNSKSVKLNLVWPEYATEARISNDGGFAASKTQTKDLAASIDWELDDSVKGVYTKVVYVRFNGVADTTKTYSDDIILDTTAPTIESSSASAASSSVDVSLKATDDITGVNKVEIRNDTKIVKKDYATKVSIPMADLALSVSSSGVRKSATTAVDIRVSDNAGNWTGWQTVTVAGLTKTPAVTTPEVTTPEVKTPVVTTPEVKTSMAKAPVVTLKKSTPAKTIASYAKLKVKTGSVVSLKLSSKSTKYCKVIKSTLKGLKVGTCTVTVTVKPKAGRSTSKTVTLKVTK
jgi:hypothetical protein